MPNPFDIPLIQLARTIVALKPQLIDEMGVEALQFIDDNFAMQGYQGRTFIKWAPRKKEDKKRPGRAILVDTATLRRSFIKTDHATGTTISTDVPYARYHNEGDHSTGYSTPRRTFGTSRPFSRNLPQRQFLPITPDDSPVLNQKIETQLINTITAALPH